MFAVPANKILECDWWKLCHMTCSRICWVDYANQDNNQLLASL